MVYCPQNCSNCYELQKQSEIIWEDSRDAIKDGYPLYEETISQMTSLRINRNLGNRTGITKAPNESANGADWLWFIHNSFFGDFITYAVQAKRLDPEGLYSATNLTQIPSTINFSRQNDYIPIFIFFNHTWDYRKFPVFANYAIFQGIAATFGATYLHAAHFRKLTHKFSGKTKLTKQDHREITGLINTHSRPWFELVCRCGGGTTTIIKQLANRVQGFDLEPEIEDTFEKVDPKPVSGTLGSWFNGKEELDDNFWKEIGLLDLDGEGFNPDFIFRQDVKIGKTDD